MECSAGVSSGVTLQHVCAYSQRAGVPEAGIGMGVADFVVPTMGQKSWPAPPLCYLLENDDLTQGKKKHSSSQMTPLSSSVCLHHNTNDPFFLQLNAP